MAYLLTRRGLIAGALPMLTSAAPQATATRPATLDLRQPIGEAAECIIHRMDPSQKYRPWFAIIVADGRPTHLEHAVWDLGDTSGRFFEALITARQMIHASPQMRSAEQHIRDYLFALFGSDGVVRDPEKKAPDHMFAQGSALYALVTDYESRPTAEGRARIERMIAGLDALAEQHGDYIVFPQVATKIAPCSHQAAYQVLPAVRYYELTRYAPALAYAEKLSRWSFYHDSTLKEDGSITKTGWEGHLHAWMDTCCGALRCARAGSGLNHAEIAERCRKTYEWVRANYTSPFGWVADSVGAKTCETCTITSAIRLALELIKEGRMEYWDDIERFVRNQLVENQFHSLERLHLGSAQLAAGMRGCFESWAHPNDLIGVDNGDGDIEGCCLNGGMRGLFLAYQNAITRSGGVVRVNLLLSVGIPALEVSSHLPYEGRLDLYPQLAEPILVRCPSWLRPDAVRVDGPASVSPEPGGRYLRLTGIRPGSQISLHFDQPEEYRTHTVARKQYKCFWRGDTVVGIEPPGVRYPTYQRDAMRARRAPMEKRDTAYLVPRISW